MKATKWPYSVLPDEIITTDIGDISVSHDRILIIRYADNIDFELEKAIVAIQTCEKIAAGNKMLTMVVTGNFGHMPEETRTYLASDEVAKHRKAAAIVVSNLGHRLIASFIVRSRSSSYTSKVFRNEKNAIGWLKLIEKESE